MLECNPKVVAGVCAFSFAFRLNTGEFIMFSDG